MADAAAKIDLAKAEVAAEKAYAAAAEKTDVKTEAKPAAVKAAPKAAPAKAVKKPVAKKAAAKTVAPKKAAKPAVTKTAKATARKAAAAAPSFKDTLMTRTKATTEDLTAKVKDTVADAQDRARTALDKGTALFGDMTEFSKGNVEALVESGKILAAGLQEMGRDYVAQGKVVVETVQADVRSLAAVRTPSDFFKLQGEILRRNFDAAVATGSKQSETVIKLANDAFAPISTRVSVAIEKVRKAA